MDKIIQTLNHHIASLRPDYYASLQQPLSEDKINTLEREYNLQLPDDFKALYRWKNGQNQETFGSFVNNAMFLPLEEALHTARKLTEMIGYDFEVKNWWNQHWIPLFHNGGGDLICYDTKGVFTGKQGQIIQFWHDDSDRNVIAPSLESFLSKLNEYYQINKDRNDEFVHIDSPDGYPLWYDVLKK